MAAQQENSHSDIFSSFSTFGVELYNLRANIKYKVFLMLKSASNLNMALQCSQLSIVDDMINSLSGSYLRKQNVPKRQYKPKQLEEQPNKEQFKEQDLQQFFFQVNEINEQFNHKVTLFEQVVNSDEGQLKLLVQQQKTEIDTLKQQMNELQAENRALFSLKQESNNYNEMQEIRQQMKMLMTQNQSLQQEVQILKQAKYEFRPQQNSFQNTSPQISFQPVSFQPKPVLPPKPTISSPKSQQRRPTPPIQTKTTKISSPEPQKQIEPPKQQISSPKQIQKEPEIKNEPEKEKENEILEPKIIEQSPEELLRIEKERQKEERMKEIQREQEELEKQLLIQQQKDREAEQQRLAQLQSVKSESEYQEIINTAKPPSQLKEIKINKINADLIEEPVQEVEQPMKLAPMVKLDTLDRERAEFEQMLNDVKEEDNRVNHQPAEPPKEGKKSKLKKKKEKEDVKEEAKEEIQLENFDAPFEEPAQETKKKKKTVKDKAETSDISMDINPKPTFERVKSGKKTPKKESLELELEQEPKPERVKSGKKKKPAEKEPEENNETSFDITMRVKSGKKTTTEPERIKSGRKSSTKKVEPKKTQEVSDISMSFDIKPSKTPKKANALETIAEPKSKSPTKDKKAKKDIETSEISLDQAPKKKARTKSAKKNSLFANDDNDLEL
ncbi:Hypothetical_protein [Hexamita inflata]|uniref:Hypothetical_protein n=1 Tax=Hexamita inflata TaxID=28002 RepID=A0AA86QL50_9EUKA|nr:Hypothetical protein HINF_LOCUS43432 [Hexamita inflata]